MARVRTKHLINDIKSEPPDIPKRGRPKGGRPTSCTPRIIEKAFDYALFGCTNDKLAELLDVPLNTFNTWFQNNRQFKRAIIYGREKADKEIIKSMYQRAKGYDYVEREYARQPIYDIVGGKRCIVGYEDELVLVKEIHKQMAADVAAAKYLLWNHTKAKPRNEQWTDRQETGISGPGDEPLVGTIQIEYVQAVDGKPVQNKGENK